MISGMLNMHKTMTTDGKSLGFQSPALIEGGGDRERRRERVCAKRRKMGPFDSRQICLILPRPSLALRDTLLTNPYEETKKQCVSPCLSLSVFPSNIQVR